MELSSALVKSLATVTNDSASSSVSTTAYGTAVVSGDKVYVQLDGSSLLTSISVTTDVRTGDRVMVSIENHVATIVSNLTTPASGYTASETEKAVEDVANNVTVLKNGKTTIYCSDEAPSAADYDLVENDLWYEPTTTTDGDKSYTSYTLYRWTVSEDMASTWTLVQYGTDSIGAKSILADNISVANLASINANLGAITGGSLNIGNGTFKVDSSGNLTATSATITGTITAGANSKIGAWTVTDYKICAGDANTGVAAMQVPSGGTYVFAAGGTSHSSYADCPFRVTKAGKLYATDAVLQNSVYMYDEMNESTYKVFYADGGLSFPVSAYFANEINVEGDASFYDLVTFDGDVYFNGTVKTSVKLDAGAYTGTGISCRWEDYDSSNTRHYIVYRGEDALTAYFGYAGSSTYSTVSVLRGRTVKYQNSSGTTSLSDERLKTDWQSLDDWDGFFDHLKPYAFKYIEGTSGRYHIGMGAQTVEQALLDAGLTTQDFAGLVKYPAKTDEEGNGYHGYDEEYGLIYTEFVGLLVDQVQKLKARVSDLEAKYG